MSDPGVCTACKGPMKPLFTGFYCPRDCDRPHSQIAAPKDTQCRDAMCRGQGTKTHSLGQGVPMVWYDNYRCALCTAEWLIPSPPSGGIP